TQPTTRPAEVKALTFWQAKMGDKAPYIEIDLHQQASLARLVWGSGDDKLAVKNMPTDLTITLRGDGPEKVITLTNQSQPTGNVVDLKGVSARTIRIDITRFRGDAPAIGQIILTDTQGNQLLPADVALAGIDNAAVLEFNVGQSVFARYTDVDNETPGVPIVRQSRRLGARYHDGVLSLAKPADLEARGTNFRPAWRLDLNASPHIMLNDPDLDVTPNPDSARVEAFSETGARQMLELTETGNSTGVFVAPLSLSANPEARDNPRLLYVRPGDLVWFKYLDQQNMQPGYKTFRYLSVLENQPTAGDWQNLPALATAWPFEIKPTEADEIPVAVRPAGKGRLTLAIHDPDAMANAATGVTVRINTLIGNVAQELMLPCTAPGVASQQLDLVLGDTQPERRLGDPAKAAPANELAVYGDDIIRVSYTDVRIPAADLQTRAVADDAAGKSPGRAKAVVKPIGEAADVIPVINLANPNRRAMAAQEHRLEVLRRELNARLPAYAAERKLLEERREILKKRQAAAPTKAPTTAPADGAVSEADALKETIAGLTSQIDRLNGRIERLKALGASDAPNAPMPTTQPVAAPVLTDGPLTPGQPFDLIIDDPDLPAATVEVRVRSVAGRLIQKVTVAAKRDASGKYHVRVPTKSSDDAEDKDAVSLVPGGEVIVDYENPKQAPLENVERVAYVDLASDATLTVTNAGYFDSISKFRLGEPIYVQVVDFDADRSAAIDQVAVVVKSSTGDREILMLSETEPHSGVFRGKIQTDNAAAKPNDDVLQAGYGGTIEVTYMDYLRESREQSLAQVVRLQVSGGTDGTVEGFSRQFKDAQEEMKLWYRTGQSAYQIGRRLYLAGAYERADEYLVESTDYFSQLVARFPEDALAASSNYYLGNIQSLKGNNREALARFQEIVTRWPKSDFVAKARFKIGQALENMGRFDEAADAYVLLTYHHPDDPHVPMAMIRMMNYFARGEQFADAVSIAQKFVEKFPKHENAGPVALKAGQWLAVSSRPDEAVAWFVQTEKVFAASDKDMPALLYWHAATLIQMQQLSKAPRGIVVLRPEKIRELLQRVIYDYPRSEYANLSRMALEQVVEQR
ncbi:MAG: tetratricopeptide repeat protein, partial [Tepidisphaeraceae bacterium]